MPRTVEKRDKLGQLPIASDQAMRRNLQTLDFRKIRMFIRIELIQEQAFNVTPAKYPRRQADAVDDNQIQLVALGSGVIVG